MEIYELKKNIEEKNEEYNLLKERLWLKFTNRRIK